MEGDGEGYEWGSKTGGRRGKDVKEEVKGKGKEREGRKRMDK